MIDFAEAFYGLMSSQGNDSMALIPSSATDSFMSDFQGRLSSRN